MEKSSAFGATGVVAARRHDIGMKIFDWKKRDGFEKVIIPEGAAIN